MPLSMKFSAIAILFVFFSFAECSAGKCLKYGHACWGGHGKRSDSRNTIFREEPSSKEILIPKWFLSKLIQSPMDLRYMHTRDQDPSLKQHPEQLFSSDADVDDFKGPEIYDTADDFLSEDSDFDDAFLKKESTPSNRKPKLILNKRSASFN